MKKINRFISFFLLIGGSLINVSCRENWNKSEAPTPTGKQLFGNLAILIENYHNRIVNLEARKKANAQSFEIGLALNREIKALKAEADSSIAKCINNFENPLILPVKQVGNRTSYRISEMIVEKATLNNIVMRANIKILREPLPGDTIYIQLYTGNAPSTNWIKFGTSDSKKVGNICRFMAEIRSQCIIGVTKAVSKTQKDYDAVKTNLDE
jgi:hypothetical protein